MAKKPKGSKKFAAAVPVLVSVTVCGLLLAPTTTLPKLSEAGESVKMMLPVPLPVPLSGSLWGLPGALSQMVTVPDLVPAEVGVNHTVTLQEAPAWQGGGAIVALVEVAGATDTGDLQRLHRPCSSALLTWAALVVPTA